MSACSAIHLEATGWSRLTCASTSLRRIRLCREEISTALNLVRFELGFRVPDDAVAALLRDQLDHDPAVVALLLRPGDADLLLREAHPAELDGEAPERARVASGGVRAGPRHLGHRVEAVQDVRRESDLLRELGVDVDRVEVARRARVAVREVLVRRDLELDLHGQTPLTMFVQVPRTTSC